MSSSLSASRRLRAAVLTVAGLIVLALTGTLSVTTASAAPAVSVHINSAFQTRASHTGKGGIWASSFSIWPCGDQAAWDSIKIREFTVTISKAGKTVKKTHEEMDLIRLNPGTYRVATKLRYVYRGKSTTKTKTQTVKVTRKTDANSVSTSEYKKIKKGQTLAQVRKIIGGEGEYAYGYLSMDASKFEHSVNVGFSKGRVTDKSSNRNVYDWC